MIPPTEERDTPRETVVSLPWPDKMLSPNARVHWGRKAKATKAAREDAHMLVRATLGPRKPSWPGAKIAMLFCPPDNRRRDRDNLIASMKAATDGIADALGVDDSKFECSYAIGNAVKGGSVRVEIRGVL